MGAVSPHFYNLLCSSKQTQVDFIIFIWKKNYFFVNQQCRNNSSLVMCFFFFCVLNIGFVLKRQLPKAMGYFYCWRDRCLHTQKLKSLCLCHPPTHLCMWPWWVCWSQYTYFQYHCQISGGLNTFDPNILAEGTKPFWGGNTNPHLGFLGGWFDSMCLFLFLCSHEKGRTGTTNQKCWEAGNVISTSTT